jgi:twinkle protein
MSLLDAAQRQKIIDFADKYLGEYQIRTSGQDEKLIPTLCPLCHGGSHGKDKHTFCLFLNNGTFVCKRGSCGRHGRFEELVKEISGEEVKIQRTGFTKKSEKQFNMPKVQVFDPTEEVYKYFESRKISRSTVDAMKVGADFEGNIVFRFFWNGEDVYHKFRKPRKPIPEDKGRKEWQESGTKAILFNMDGVVFSQPLIITEGEIDAMSLYEAGLTNVVSVPCGCDNNDWVTYCYDWLEKFSTIILFGDNDEPGKRGIESWTKKLGEYRVLIVKDYPEIPNTNPVKYCKDANEILYRFGESTLIEMVESAEDVKAKGLIRVADVTPIDPTKVPRIKTNIPMLDDALGGLAEGCVTIFTGKSGNGKSTLSGLILLNAIEQGYTCMAYSGELSAGLFQEWILAQAAGSEWLGLKWDAIRNRNIPYVHPDVQRRILDWLGDRLLLYDNNEQFVDLKQTDAIMNVFSQAARKYNAKLFLIDNMMTSVADSDDEWRAQAVFINAIKKFATHYQAHVMLVAHPRKTKMGSDITKDDISGTSAIMNLCDNAVVIKRPDLEVLKNRLDGKQVNIACCYAGDSRRIFQADKGDLNKFSWDKTGLTPPKVRADSMPEYGIQLSQLDKQPF